MWGTAVRDLAAVDFAVGRASARHCTSGGLKPALRMKSIVRTIPPFSQSDASRAAHGRGEAHQQKFCGALWLSGHLPSKLCARMQKRLPAGTVMRSRGAFGLIPRGLRAGTYVLSGLKAAGRSRGRAAASAAKVRMLFQSPRATRLPGATHDPPTHRVFGRAR